MTATIIPFSAHQAEAQARASAVIRLPTAKADPVLQHPRRGRLPACVPSLRAVRLERQRIADALAEEKAECMRNLCIKSFQRVQSGAVKGLAIIEIRADGSAQCVAGGMAQDDLELFSSVLYTLSDPEFPWRTNH